jgi:hypothetical protein
VSRLRADCASGSRNPTPPAAIEEVEGAAFWQESRIRELTQGRESNESFNIGRIQKGHHEPSRIGFVGSIRREAAMSILRRRGRSSRSAATVKKPKLHGDGRSNARARKSPLPAKIGRRAFLAAFEECGNVTVACQLAGVSRSAVYLWREDPEFEAEFEAAGETAADALEAEARRRAVEGFTEPVFQGGAQVGTITRYSDTLLIFLLKGRRRGVFGDRQELTGADGKPLMGEPLTDDERATKVLGVLTSVLRSDADERGNA